MEQYSAPPAADEFAPYYAGYIAQVPGGNIVEILQRQAEDTAGLLASLDDDRAAYRYAPGKWSIKEVLGHLVDGERIFAYRALCIARNDTTPLPGFSQDDYVLHGRFDERHIGDMAREYGHVRASTIDLFRSLPAEAWTRRGVANGREVSVRAIAHIIAGHELHHLHVLRTKYLA